MLGSTLKIYIASEKCMCYHRLYSPSPSVFIRDIFPLYKPSSVVYHYNRSGPEPMKAWQAGRADATTIEMTVSMRSDKMRWDMTVSVQTWIICCSRYFWKEVLPFTESLLFPLESQWDYYLEFMCFACIFVLLSHYFFKKLCFRV